MRDIRAVFQEFWGGFVDRRTDTLIRAFQEGYAVIQDASTQGRPAAPPFPYVTYSLVLPDFLEGTIISASIWSRNIEFPGDFGLVDDVLSQISERIPTRHKRLSEGVVLDCGKDGQIRLMRSNPFIDYLGDPEDQTITRGIVRVIVQNYIP